MSQQTTTHLDDLQQRLKGEAPVLADVVERFRELDRVAHAMQYLAPNESFAGKISWWPLVSVLGTFSAGKSSFINDYLGLGVQRTGNQAVDDRFTVLTYSADPDVRVLPGSALDSDPRLPFYRISEAIERSVPGEGRRIDTYLQVKACNSPRLRGKILIDSPGFDADAQRTSILRIVDHIVDLSDLVLIMFDARHPEPGAMRDTLQHLVGRTVARADADKFLYVLNQIDTAARQDNLEEVVAAWQRALAQHGLTAGQYFYTFVPELAVDMPEALRGRYAANNKVAREAIITRIDQIHVSRAYRIVKLLDQSARQLLEGAVPELRSALGLWRRRVLWIDLGLLVVVGGGLLAASVGLGYWNGLHFQPPWRATLEAKPWLLWTVVASAVVLVLLVHHLVRSAVARALAAKLRRGHEAQGSGDLARAFLASTRPLRPLWSDRPVGWGRRAERRVAAAGAATPGFVQQLNDLFARPDAAPRLAHPTQSPS
ncbi:MAG: dynamin family protein [Planctomycetota bacterium]